MVITTAAVQAYISFPSSMVNGPTDAEWTAWITAAEIKFEAQTGIAFVEATKKHYNLYMTYMKLSLWEWQVQQAGGVASLSSEGGSAVLRSKLDLENDARRGETLVMDLARESPIAFGSDLTDSYDDR